MKGFKLLLALLVALWSINLNAQQSNVLPPLKDNQAAQDIIQKEINTLEVIIKNNPSNEWNRRLDLYQTAMSFLNEPTTIPPTTTYALTSAFLNNEVKWENINDGLALLRFNHKQWPKEFQDLINLVKI